ncbi:DEAD/DEAH box helicase [Salinimonas sediminis]|uniref:DEAD/DEAH box helicase n=1 Tax=Salinimonas sediminis TaxID=2303538 RepID=A0A346NLY2_9ALTE|nr:DEAD/DEAH box helicase [Salinimonas sediminis]AXR06539.1 DEAD/DEAH box helicase [Salinimonas sediminis]
MQISDLPVHHKIINRLQTKGFDTLTEIQQKAMLPAISGKDIIASSQTGSGKTLAFLIPAINRLLNEKALSRKDPRVVILAPTRELAKQVFSEAKHLTTGLNLPCALVVGGENYNNQVKVLRKNPAIVVGTAGRIADHLLDKTFFLNGLELLIFDEADRMLDLGFMAQLNLINQFADHRKRQTMLFSATLDNIELTHLSKNLLKAPVRITVGQSTAAHQDITEKLYFADNISHKDTLLTQCINEQQYNQAIVFTATRDDTDRICAMLNEHRLEAIALRGDLPQNQRAQIMSEFSRGQHSILVTTDVASRGLDLLKVGLVVNYDLPKHADEYIHRIGRTGRAGQKGHAVSLVGPRDWQSFTAIQAHLAYPVECQAHSEAPARFNGIKPKPDSANTPAGSSAKTSNKDSTQSALKKTKRRVDTTAGKDVGEMPVMRKKRTPAQPDDDEEQA